MLERHRSSPLPEWAIPLCYVAVSMVAGLTLPRLERTFLPESTAPISVSGALTIFSSITSGMIALTGIVFSLAFVMVQFSAVAYSPRLVMWVSRDPVLWHSIGIFTATFLYSIGVMAWIDRAGSGKVPFLAGWFVILLTLASVLIFIALIQRLTLLQISRMLSFTGDLGREVIEKLYPPIDTPASVAGSDEFGEAVVTQTVVHSGGPQSLQSIDAAALLAMTLQSGGSAEVMVSVGDTLISGMPVLRVFGTNSAVTDEMWKQAFETGEERTFDQDPKYGIRLLVDIAIKALSPAINDPTTAVQALDQIQDHLLRLGRRRLEIGAVRDSHGALRLIVPYPSWEDFLHLALDEIRFCGATSVQVMRRMRALTGDLIAALPAERHPGIEYHQKRLDAIIARSFADDEDKREASMEDRQGLGIPKADRHRMDDARRQTKP